MLRVAAIQTRSGISLAENIASVSAQIRTAAEQGATLIATPEMTHLLQRSPKRLFASIFDQDNDPAVKAFGALAKTLGITLLIGSLAIRVTNDKAVNRCFVFGPDGSILATYDKIHMFDVTVSRAETWKESSVYRAGDVPVVVETPAATLGLSVCYDVRFPALYHHYAGRGADILTVPAAFTKPTGEAHWETLLRARAIETGSFIIAPAQGGTHEDGRATWGHSAIIGPWGDIIAALNHDNPAILYADIDLQDVANARAKIPAWQRQDRINAILS